MEMQYKIDQRLITLDKKFSNYIYEKKLPCIVAGIYVKDKIIFSQKYGYSNIDTKNEINFNSIFRLASVSKVIVSLGALLLIDKGKLSLEDKLSTFFAEAKNLKVFVKKDGSIKYESLKNEITILDLFTHTSGFIYPDFPNHPIDQMYAEFIGPNNKNISQMKNSEFIAKLLQLPLKAQPGTKYYYSLSTDVIGAVIEKITGQTLGQYLQHEIFDKLEMIDTCFNLPDEKRHRLVSLHGISSEGLLQVANPEEQLRGNVNLEFESGGGG